MKSINCRQPFRERKASQFKAKSPAEEDKNGDGPMSMKADAKACVNHGTSSFMKPSNKKMAKNSGSESDSVSMSESSKAIRLFPQNSGNEDRDNFSADYVEKRKRDEEPDRLTKKHFEHFPSFESDERDENVPKL